MRGPATIAALLLAIVGTSTAQAATPGDEPYPVGGAAMIAAQAIARATWGTDPCAGQVAIAWVDDDPRFGSRAHWLNPRSSYDDPASNYDCDIALNSAVAWNWPWFCTVVVHEYGHLAGHAHGADGPDVMSPVYRAPLPACAATPDPSAAVSPASGGAASASTSTSSSRSVVLRRSGSRVRSTRPRSARRT